MMKKSTYNWDMVQVLQSASPASCKTPSTFIDSIRPDNQLRKNKESKIEIQLPTNCIILPWPSTQNPGLKEVDLELSAKRGANRTRALVSLYWSSQNLHLKESPNQIPHRSTKVDPIRSCRTWKTSDWIPESYALQHIKATRATNTHYWGYK